MINRSDNELIKKQEDVYYNRNFLKELLKDIRIPKNFGLRRCIQCGNCSSACPAARYTAYRPRKFIYDILTGQKEKILASEDIWACYSCFSCNLRCPRNNNPGILIHIIRELALAAGYGQGKILPFKTYLISLREFGIGLTPLSVPIETFAEELGEDWVNMRQTLPEILKELGMDPRAPRELPLEARNQIKTIMELAGIENTLKKFETKERE